MTNGLRPRLYTALLLGLALACFGLCAFQVLHVGLLADDYFGGQAVARHAAEHPNVVDRIVTTFTRRWADDLKFWHRPILALSAQADYAIFGPDGRRHHVASLVLWVLGAFAAAWFSRRMLQPSLVPTAAVVAALALLHPSAVEALTWLAARDDLLFALFGVLTLRARVARPDSSVAALPWLVLALFSKESAQVLVPLLNVATLILPREQRGRFKLAREIAPWLVLGAWTAFRYWVLGGFQTSYGTTHYFRDFELARFFGNFGRSFTQLVAPVNLTAMAAMSLPAAAIRAACVIASAVILVMGLGMARMPGDWRRALFLLAAICAPIVFLSPVFVVSIELNGGRGLAFPGLCWAVLLGLAFDRAVRSPRLRIAVIPCVIVLLLASFVSFFAALQPYVHATEAGEAALKSLDLVPPGDEVVLLRTYDPVSAMRVDLIMQQGAYVLSAGIHPAMGPPFRAGPPAVVSMPKADEEILAIGAGQRRPWVMSLPADTFANPTFRLLGPGGSEGPPVELDPKHGSTIDPNGPLLFKVRIPPDLLPKIAALTLVTGDPQGLESRATISGDFGGLKGSGGWLEIPSESFAPPFGADTLRMAGVRLFVWWAEGRAADGSLLFRAPWAAVAVK